MTDKSSPSPYATPQSSLEISPDETPADILEFPRLSAWWVFLLIVFTLSLYMPYWLYSRSKILRNVRPSERVAPMLIYIAMTLYLLSIAGALLGGFYGPFEQQLYEL